MPSRGARSLLLGLALLLSGCAGLVGGKPPVSVGEPPRPPQPGGFSVQKGRPGYVIGAPRGTTGTTDVIGLDLARRTGFGAVVATGSGTLEAYGRSVAEAAQGPLRFYVEVHGDGQEDTMGRVEIATVGLDKEDAWRLKTLLELVRDAHLRGQPDAPRLEVAVEPADTLRSAAPASKSGGLLARSDKALHIELPRAARTTYRETYTAVLGDFLIQWTDLQASAKGQ